MSFNAPEPKPEPEERKAGAKLLAWLDAFEAQTRAIPPGTENLAKGASVYNWQMGFIREARAAMAGSPRHICRWMGDKPCECGSTVDARYAGQGASFDEDVTPKEGF